MKAICTATATWSPGPIGHLVALAQPHEINPEWRQWRFDLLPMLPEQWPLVVYEKTKDQFEVVRKILKSPTRVADRLRDGRRARGRTDLPLHLRSGGLLTSR